MAAFRINRNILECKLITAVLISFFAFVLIETYWNVNYYVFRLFSLLIDCINRNILECKLMYRSAM